MPDPHPPSPRPAALLEALTDHTDLPQGAARAVLAVPAVTKLEPTLRNALHRLQATTNRLRPETTTTTTADGILLRRRDSVVDVHVDIAVSPQRPAHLTAAAVQDALRSYLTAQQLTPGTITVAVLTIEH